ncbi:MAG TPA: DUF4783 domain-containing protein [Ferruginibacter sp.]|nr:DUF4783 domain-containing protein [Ferruginibacter sp.]HRE64613.1 DUF4783 domain-containing protein [Ferruginibacter sp.]
MKRFFILVFASLLLSSFSAFSQSGIDEVVSALKSGNAGMMAQNFDNSIEIVVSSKNSTYSKTQAEAVLKDFFNNNPVKSFQVMHKGDKGGAQFCIGTLNTKTGNYRTTIFMKQKGDKQVLQEIRFEN